jgi:hypothetical protein
MLHVLYKINDAASGDSTCLYPRESSTPATFSESWSFIWQPNVSRKKVGWWPGGGGVSALKPLAVGGDGRARASKLMSKA